MMRYLTLTLTTLLLTLTACNDEHYKWNLDEEVQPVTGFDGTRESCDPSWGEDYPVCIRDGDRFVYTCNQPTDSKRLWKSFCTDTDSGEPRWCFSARGTEDVRCLTDDEILNETDEGFEPGSDRWQQKKDGLVD